MPQRFVDDLEGKVVGEKVHESGLGEDIFSADLNCEDALLLNIRQHRVFSIAHNVGCLICGECIGKFNNSVKNGVVLFSITFII